MDILFSHCRADDVSIANQQIPWQTEGLFIQGKMYVKYVKRRDGQINTVDPKVAALFFSFLFTFNGVCFKHYYIIIKLTLF